MLTLITGTPGASKTCMAVWEICQKVPGSFIEVGGEQVPRRLLSNIRDLLVDHEHIDAKDLECWQTWAKPGDVIVFDEVQEVWRPRGLGSKVPPEIAALETHRHMGVDLVLITQHPMLVDTNVRRLVNQHFHIRRITRGTAMIYEWDHCENPNQTKGAINTRVFFHRKKMYALYKSAQAHTKPKARLPALTWVAVASLAALGYFGPTAYARITGRFSDGMAGKDTKNYLASAGQKLPGVPAPLPGASAPAVGVPGAVPASFAASAPTPTYAGCAMRGNLCRCYDAKGERFEVELSICVAKVPQSPAFDLARLASSAEVGQPSVRGLADLEAFAFMRERRSAMR
jgi:zona occludens toxin